MLESETVGKSPTQAVERIVSVYLGQSQGTEKPYLCPLAMLGSELSHSVLEVRAVATDCHQRFVQLIANQLTHRAKRERLAVAGGVMSTLVGAVTLAEIAPDSAMAGAILNDAKRLIKKHILRPCGGLYCDSTKSVPKAHGSE